MVRAQMIVIIELSVMSPSDRQNRYAQINLRGYNSSQCSWLILLIFKTWFINLLIYNYRDYFPWSIFYKAFIDDVDNWDQKLEASNIPITRNEIQVLDEMVSKMKDEVAKLNENDMNKTIIADKLNELRQLIFPKN